MSVHEPLLRHGAEEQGFEFLLQVEPVKSALHLHINDPFTKTHEPKFEQFDRQLLLTVDCSILLTMLGLKLLI
jgi:hypothetical protein